MYVLIYVAIYRCDTMGYPLLSMVDFLYWMHTFICIHFFVSINWLHTLVFLNRNGLIACLIVISVFILQTISSSKRIINPLKRTEIAIDISIILPCVRVIIELI